jgi:hypothetical protein
VLIRIAGVLVAVVTFCACGSPSVPSAPAAPVAPNSLHTTSKKPHDGAQAKLTFPLPSPSSTPSGGLGYISPGTKEVFVTANGTSVLNAIVQPYSTSFTQTFAVPSGNVTFVAQLETVYGTVLSQANWRQSIKANQTTTLTPVFEGLVQHGLLGADNASPPVGKPVTIHVKYTGYDAAGSVIDTGTYMTPVGVAFKDSTHHMELQGSSQFAGAASVVTIAYDGKLMKSYATVSTTGESSNQSLNLIGSAYAVFPVNHEVASMAAGPKGTLLYSYCERNCTVKTLDAGGKIQTIGSAPAINQMVLGRDGAIWFTEGETSGKVGKMTMSGQVTQYRLPKDIGGGTYQIAVGPDHNVWFTDMGGISQITQDGRITHRTAPIMAFPERSTYLTSGDNRFYFDDPPFVVCSMPLKGAGTCYGFADVAAIDARVEMSAPLLFYKGACFLATSSVNGGKKTVSTVDAQGTLHRVSSSGHDTIVPQAIGVGGELLALGGSNYPVNDFGLTIQTYAGNALHNTTYPLPLNVSASGYSANKLLVIGNNVWFVGNGALYRFNYRQ